ncbi:MAG TPA: M57 family metalloprotease [Chitinophaga sp.]|uniref:M57 family metalloprotease n=1 Tax=Chitinophaga sp. TaxID=1869181 RepID=UPI002D1D9738|nr:M57 family metalloprotease [Chitinophaga sp.]HVI48081.1 M57 family metalloprotease [Chitinophaga sp.]
MKQLLPILSSIIFAVLIITACKKSDNDIQSTPGHSRLVLDYIRQLGFSIDNIRETKDEYIVEDDIVFSKNMQLPATPLTEQSFTSNRVSLINGRHITLRIDASAAVLANEIYAAIQQWNTVPNSSLFLTPVVSTSSYDILIKNTVTTGNTCGSATFPSFNGKPGNSIVIDVLYLRTLPVAQRQASIAHQIGHTIGFKHTDGPGDPFIGPISPGILGPDSLSIMNSWQCGSAITVLSAKDKRATAYLFPAP